MTTFNLLICFLPIVFMIHDFEEIILFKYWISGNKKFLEKKFPTISKKFLPRFDKLSTAGFALATAEEFVILSIITLITFVFQTYYLWFMVFMGFAVHLLVHFFQWIIIRKYIPTIVTTILFIPYCIYTFLISVEYLGLSATKIIVLSLSGFVIIGLNVGLAHKLAEKFDNLTTVNLH